MCLCIIVQYIVIQLESQMCVKYLICGKLCNIVQFWRHFLRNDPVFPYPIYTFTNIQVTLLHVGNTMNILVCVYVIIVI